MLLVDTSLEESLKIFVGFFHVRLFRRTDANANINGTCSKRELGRRKNEAYATCVSGFCFDIYATPVPRYRMAIARHAEKRLAATSATA